MKRRPDVRKDGIRLTPKFPEHRFPIRLSGRDKSQRTRRIGKKLPHSGFWAIVGPEIARVYATVDIGKGPQISRCTLMCPFIP